jgi:hypothetical protein
MRSNLFKNLRKLNVYLQYNTESSEELYSLANKSEKLCDDCELDDDLLNENSRQEANPQHGTYASSTTWNQDGNVERKRNTGSIAGRGHRPVTVSGPILAQV